MMGIFSDVLRVNKGDRIRSSVQVAEKLMVSDPETCKAGYTWENALIVVTESYDLTPMERARVAAQLAPRTVLESIARDASVALQTNDPVRADHVMMLAEAVTIMYAGSTDDA